MDISYDYYKVFYYVCKYKSITGAALALMNNQPNITRTIKKLESALGCTLFIRTKHGVELTSEGERLYGHVKIAFEHIEAGEEELALDKILERGKVSVGVSEVALHCLLLPILKEYRSLYPGIHLRIANLSTPQALNALINGLVDFAVVTTPIEKSEILTETYIKPICEVAICSWGYSFPKNRAVSLSELSSYPTVSLGTQTKTYEFYTELFATYGIPFSPEIEATTADQILPMVKSDLGIGFVPEDFVKNDPDVQIINLKEKIPRRYVCLVKRKGYKLSIAASKLERLILNKKEL